MAGFESNFVADVRMDDNDEVRTCGRTHVHGNTKPFADLGVQQPRRNRAGARMALPKNVACCAARQRFKRVRPLTHSWPSKGLPCAC